MLTESTIKPTRKLIYEKNFVQLIDLDSVTEIIKDEEILYSYDAVIINSEAPVEYFKNNFDRLFAELKQREFNELDLQAKEKRKKLLEETDNYALTDRTMSEKMSNYRQHLRDITSQPNYPYEIDWGTKPSNEGENVMATMQDLENSLEELGV